MLRTVNQKCQRVPGGLLKMLLFSRRGGQGLLQCHSMEIGLMLLLQMR